MLAGAEQLPWSAQLEVLLRDDEPIVRRGHGLQSHPRSLGLHRGQQDTV